MERQLWGFKVVTGFSDLACRKPWLSKLVSSWTPGRDRLKPEELEEPLEG